MQPQEHTQNLLSMVQEIEQCSHANKVQPMSQVLKDSGLTKRVSAYNMAHFDA